MIIWHFKESTGELLAEGMADPDPMQAGGWLIPAHATNVTPPEHVEGSTRHYIAGGWEYREIPPPPPEPKTPAPPEPETVAPATTDTTAPSVAME